MVAQRLPFLKNLSPIFGTSAGVNFAAPLTVTFVGMHSLSGQSIMIVPVNGATNPSTTTVGEQFLWSFKASSFILRSVKVEMDGIETTPSGLEITGGQSGVYFLAGTPTEAGELQVTITGYRFSNQSGQTTEPFLLNLNIDPGEEPLTPYEEFVATFWSGEDLNDPLLVGANSDSDGDGIQNVMEFVLDLDPTKSDVLSGVFGVDPADPQKVRYEIPLNIAAGAVAVSFQEGSDLNADWADVPAENVTRTETTIILSAPIVGKKFYRLKVVLSDD